MKLLYYFNSLLRNAHCLARLFHLCSFPTHPFTPSVCLPSIFFPSFCLIYLSNKHLCCVNHLFSFFFLRSLSIILSQTSLSLSISLSLSLPISLLHLPVFLFTHFNYLSKALIALTLHCLNSPSNPTHTHSVHLYSTGPSVKHSTRI